MKFLFKIHFHTNWGQSLRLTGSIPELGNGDIKKAIPLNYKADGMWELELDLSDFKGRSIEYKYLLYFEDIDREELEWGPFREVTLSARKFDLIVLEDSWRSYKEIENTLHTSAFKNVIFQDFGGHLSNEGKKLKKRKKNSLTHKFQLKVPRISEGYSVVLGGNHQSLGNWENDKVIHMEYSGKEDMWQAEFSLDTFFPIKYKYGIYDLKKKEVVEWEAGEDRYYNPDAKLSAKKFIIKTDEKFRYNKPWRGAGVAIPVFSLRSNNGLGVGEFLDLKLMVDWAKKTNLQMIQVLPINDTVATHTWTDSYPYAAISVFALHPIYLNIQAIGALSAKVTNDILLLQKDILNKKEDVDYEVVMRAKSRFYKLIFDEQKDQFLADPAFKEFFETNKSWLVPYAAFSYLRDLFGTPDFNKWEGYERVSENDLEKLTSPAAAQYPDVAVHYFIQFHLHKQLLEAASYARENGIVLKGDIPIGIYRHSVDAWIKPELFHMHGQAGAPPDDFAQEGQNWGFPTYNWEEMQKDNFSWWKERFKKMESYFDAFRIDHILGFFRIWEIPFENVEGILGHFNPALPFSVEELQQRGLHFDEERLCKPYIREHLLLEIFGEEKEEVIQEYLEEYQPGVYKMKPEFDTQRKVEEALKIKKDDALEVITQKHQLKKGLFKLLGEVLLLPVENSDGRLWNPRNAMHFTQSFKELDGHAQRILDEAYVDYFYHRHNDFWKEKAMVKLPALKAATNMLICGEDLGMVPACVPGVMDELGFLSLAIQRMPNNSDLEFGKPWENPYLSVCSPSTHDMSNIRGWWEEDANKTQRYFNQVMGQHGEAPKEGEPWVCQEIVLQHLHSSSMWAVFPIQDLLAISAELRRKNHLKEQINVPSNPKHYWKYRFHLNLEELIQQDGFNLAIKRMVSGSDRVLPY
ncbi:4-alpha-glucanotransferase [Flexithrix dorotheae]|uniref:4-alpha-glucanotransferase n=1 Tax=Flexithrix dorotheae TaxID=70993 RepID=UPI00036B7FDB|nr:4-alpha-glucanotransferase [Flexithrix dorotheae]